MAAKERPTTLIGWAGEHWFITGFIIVPSLISLPVALIKAVRGPNAAELELKRQSQEADAKLLAASKGQGL